MKKAIQTAFCFIIIALLTGCTATAQTAQPEVFQGASLTDNVDYSWEDTLYVPTMIQKIEDTYFLVDCWHHRVLYSESITDNIQNWKTLSDEGYKGGHTIASDGELYLLDNTDANEVLVYKKENGAFIKTQTMKGVLGRPHFVVYDESKDRFLVIGSIVGKIYIFKNRNGTLEWSDTVTLPEIQSSYVRSISIINEQLYTVSGPGKLFVYDMTDTDFILNKAYDIPDCYFGMNQVVKIDEYYYLTVNTDNQGNVAAATILRVKDLDDISKGQEENLYETLGFATQPYFITHFDNRYFLTEISAEGENGIVSFDIHNGTISDVQWLFRFSTPLNSSIDRYNERYLSKAETVDVILFAGQSNMAGHGDAAEAPVVEKGYAYNAISAPEKLSPITEPFGLYENRADGINDTFENMTVLRKTGSLVSAFANSYYLTTGVPIVGVSCSEGATQINEWLPGTNRYNDLIQRYHACMEYLNRFPEQYQVRNVFLVWCQGESDGDADVTEAEYYEKFTELSTALVENGVDKCMIIRIGNYRDDAVRYDDIIHAQTQICKDNENCILISTRFAEMAGTNMMKDSYHYTQCGYNLVGMEAGANAGYYANSGSAPNLYDYEYHIVYKGHE